jgi:nicotinamidase-related amidase
MKTALLIIDVQNAMIDVENPVYRSGQTIKSIQSLILKARTRFIPIVYVQHNEAGSEFEFGKETWKIYDGIKPNETDTIIHKTFSDSFEQTNLKQVLDGLMINHVVICGMQTDYCVNATSTRAFDLGYKVTIIKDAHSTWESNGLSAETIINQHHDLWSDRIDLVNEEAFKF